MAQITRHLFWPWSQATYLLQVQVHNWNKVQRMCILVIVRAAIAAVHPQLNQAAIKWHHVHCTAETGAKPGPSALLAESASSLLAFH